MFFACILLTVAVAGGMLLTFLYQPYCPVILRLCMGACSGPALMATLGFVLSSFLGLTVTSVVLSAGILFLTALLVAIVGGDFRSNLGLNLNQGVSFRWSMLFYAGLAILLALTFGQNMVEGPAGIDTGVANNLGDLPFHLNVIASFVDGHNIPVEDPGFSGVRFTYPVLADFLTAMLVRAGAPVSAAIWLQNMMLALALTGLLHYWTQSLTRNRLAAFFAPLLLIFSGGLGWWLLMQDVRQSDGGLIAVLAHLPRDYTVMNNTIFRWGNSLTTLLLPERSFLFGLPLAVLIFHQWWIAIDASESQERDDAKQNKSTRHMLAAGVCAGLLPLIHTHGFVVALGTGACLALFFRRLWRGWLIFFVVALLAGIPAVLWLSRGSAVDASKFVAWQIGWDRAGFNPFWFWFVNTGLFIPTLLAAIFWRGSSYAAPRRLVKFYAPFWLWFVVPNFFKLSPWIWDNIKFLFYWYVASVPLAAFVLARLWQERSRPRWIAAGLLAALTLSGALDVLRVVTHAVKMKEFTPDGILIADFIRSHVPPGALVLHSPAWDSPVYLTGRRTLAGFSGWIWSRGLDGSRREADLRTIYSGGREAKALLTSYHIDYVLIGPQEWALGVNQTFWATCSKLAQIGEYQLYKGDCQQPKP